MHGIRVRTKIEGDVRENKNKTEAGHVSPLLHICCGEVKPVYRPSFANRASLVQILGLAQISHDSYSTVQKGNTYDLKSLQ